LKLALAAVRRLADRFPHSLYSAGLDPNELEIAFSNHMEQASSGISGDSGKHAEYILLDAIKKRSAPAPTPPGKPVGISESRALTSVGNDGGSRDRVEDLLYSIVGLEHVKSHVSVDALLLELFVPDNDLMFLLLSVVVWTHLQCYRFKS